MLATIYGNVHSPGGVVAPVSSTCTDVLQECSRSPEEVERESGLRSKLEQKEVFITNLQHGIGVLKAKVSGHAGSHAI
jgi:hypothetical protein